MLDVLSIDDIAVADGEGCYNLELEVSPLYIFNSLHLSYNAFMISLMLNSAQYKENGISVLFWSIFPFLCFPSKGTPIEDPS